MITITLKNQNKHNGKNVTNVKNYTKSNHTNRLNGFLPTATGKETVESTLKFSTERRDWCFSNVLAEVLVSLLLLLLPPLEKNEPLFHLNDPMPCVKGKESLLFE